MKILSAEQIRRADAYTIENEPVASIDLMERAASACYQRIEMLYGTDRPFHVFCGIGNNGGDGLVIARYLHNAGYEVHVHIVRFSSKTSEDFATNEEHLRKLKLDITDIRKKEAFPDLPENAVVVDALFGTGLSRPAKGLAAQAIEHINESGCEVVAVDMPSGLFAEDNTENTRKTIIRATRTLSFEVPKLAFFFADNAPYVGHWELIPIGLDAGFIASLEAEQELLEPFHFHNVLKIRPRFSHKGTYGHSLLIGGSYGKMGALVLAARACLRSGTGLLTTHVPACGYDIVQNSVPEGMCQVDTSEQFIANPGDISAFNAIGVGPGLGKGEETQKMLKLLIQNTSIPLVIDADALNILGENKTWLHFLPAGSVLTPHPKEFDRMAGEAAGDHDRYRRQREFAAKYQVVVVLKGAYTSVASPGGQFFFNDTGNPGMATGGTGDVLTGIITGLMAQGYSSLQAALLGVHLHGLAGDGAMEQYGMEAMTAGDLVSNLGEAFHRLRMALLSGEEA